MNYTYDEADRLKTVTGDARYAGAINYDAHGNTLTLGSTTLGYDMADRHVRTTDGATVVTYVRDPADRILSRSVNGTVAAKYAYCGPTDGACATLDAAGNVLERVIGLPGGATLTLSGAGQHWGYANVHGDIAAQADAAGAKQGGTSTYDPYGQPLGGLPDQLTGSMDFGWLGQHERPLERQGSLATIEMGARQYVPGLGRFLEVDPVRGGSANDYEYGNGDPVNSMDLSGLGPIEDDLDAADARQAAGLPAWPTPPAPPADDGGSSTSAVDARSSSIGFDAMVGDGIDWAARCAFAACLSAPLDYAAVNGGLLLAAGGGVAFAVASCNPFTGVATCAIGVIAGAELTGAAIWGLVLFNKTVWKDPWKNLVPRAPKLW